MEALGDRIEIVGEQVRVHDPFRDAQAARLKAAGLTFHEVGRRLGVSRSTAHRMTTRALREYVARPHAEARQLAEVELDQLARQAWQVLTGQHNAVSGGRVVTLGGVPIEDTRPKLEALRTLLAIAERRARLLGLDAPAKRQVEVISESAVDAEIARLEREIAARAGALPLADDDVVEL